MYDQLEAKLHDEFWAAEGASAELLLLEKFLQMFPGTALELGCGSGRLLLPLIENGYLMEGLDNSEDMLQLCRDKNNFGPILHCDNMLDFQTGSVYGAITIPAFTLQFITHDKVAELFSNIKQHLHPGGGFYFTTFIPWAEITGELEEGEWFLDQESKLADGNTARCHTKFEIKRLSQQLNREHRYEMIDTDGNLLETSSSKHKLTWYWPREIETFLTEAGFTIEQTIGDFDPDQPCNENSQIITVIATCNEEKTEDGELE